MNLNKNNQVFNFREYFEKNTEKAVRSGCC